MMDNVIGRVSDLGIKANADVAGCLPKPHPTRRVHIVRRLALAASTAAIALALTAPTTGYAYERITNYVSNGHGPLSPQYLVIHETANPGASAWNHVLLWSRDDTYAVHDVMGARWLQGL